MFGSALQFLADYIDSILIIFSLFIECTFKKILVFKHLLLIFAQFSNFYFISKNLFYF